MWLRTLALAGIYAATVVLGRATRLEGTQLALVWPAAGVAFLWLARSWGQPRRLALDSTLLYAVTVAGNGLTGVPAPLALVFGAANTVQALVACAVFARLGQGV